MKKYEFMNTYVKTRQNIKPGMCFCVGNLSGPFHNLLEWTLIKINEQNGYEHFFVFAFFFAQTLSK